MFIFETMFRFCFVVGLERPVFLEIPVILVRGLFLFCVISNYLSFSNAKLTSFLCII